VGEVIHIDFSRKNVMQQDGMINPNLVLYLDSLREKGIVEDDILDTVDAINDADVYFAADDEIKAFADGWLHQFV
jgi:hypothetical protein